MTSSDKIRVFLVADVRLYREGLARALADNDSIELVGSAPIDPGGLDPVITLHPDIVLLEGAATHGRIIVQAIRVRMPGVRVVAFGIVEEADDVVRWAEAGVAGYVPRDATLLELIDTIRGVARGEFPCPARVTAQIVRRFSALAAEVRTPDSELHLTHRERQIIALLGEGLSNKQIARRLTIELSTVKNHVHHVLAKLHARRRSEAVLRLRAQESEPFARSSP